MVQNMAVNGYTQDAVLEALTASGRTITFGYEWLNSINATIGWLPNVVPGGTVGHSALSTIKGSLAVSLLGNADPGFDFLSHRVRPWISVLMPDGGKASFPQGVFLLANPSRKYDRGLITYDCTGVDQAQILIDDTVTSRYVVKAGTAYTDAIYALLLNIPDVNIAPSAQVLPIDRIWDPGTTKLQIVNDLCNSLNYGSLWFDGYGQAQVLPYTEPDSTDIGLTYSDVGTEAMFAPEVTATLDLSAVPNFIVFSVSQPGRPVLTSTFANTDPASPVSIQSRGRKIVQSDASLDVATQAELDALVKRAAINAANVYQSVEFSTPMMPVHEHRDILGVTHSGLGLGGKFAEIDWKITLSTGSLMTHTVRQVVNLDGALTGDPDVGP